jgi:ring-1,2-phenylacetyl-CoA epoxidase subunit PaaC
VRHVLFDYANAVRIRALTESSYLPLAQLAAKIQREQKYHLLHARTWFTQLGKGTEESRLRMQSALNTVFPLAFGIFESTEHTPAIAAEGIQPTEEELMDSWIDLIHPLTEQAGLKLPENPDPTVGLGGRKGYHTDYLEPLLNEMTVVFRTDPLAQW